MKAIYSRQRKEYECWIFLSTGKVLRTYCESLTLKKACSYITTFLYVIFIDSIQVSTCMHVNNHQYFIIVMYFQIVKMLVVLIVIFGVCWLPYHVYFLYSYHFPEIRSLPYIQHVFLGFYWCAMAHSMVNPIVYYFMNPK